MENKITRKSVMQELISLGVANGMDADKIEVAEKIVKSFERKSTSSGKTKTREANEALAEALYEVMENDVEYACSDLIGTVEGIGSTSKASAVVGILVEKGEVIKEKIGKKTIYKLA